MFFNKQTRMLVIHPKVPKHARLWLEALFGPDWEEPYYCSSYDEQVMGPKKRLRAVMNITAYTYS